MGCFVQGGHRPLERLAGCGAAEDAGHLRRMRRPVRGPAPVGRRRHALGHRVRAFGRSGLPSQQSQRFLSLGFWSFLIVRPKVLAKPKKKTDLDGPSLPSFYRVGFLFSQFSLVSPELTLFDQGWPNLT